MEVSGEGRFEGFNIDPAAPASQEPGFLDLLGEAKRRSPVPVEDPTFEHPPKGGFSALLRPPPSTSAEVEGSPEPASSAPSLPSPAPSPPSPPGGRDVKGALKPWHQQDSERRSTRGSLLDRVRIRSQPDSSAFSAGLTRSGAFDNGVFKPTEPSDLPLSTFEPSHDLNFGGKSFGNGKTFGGGGSLDNAAGGPSASFGGQEGDDPSPTQLTSGDFQKRRSRGGLASMVRRERGQKQQHQPQPTHSRSQGSLLHRAMAPGQHQSRRRSLSQEMAQETPELSAGPTSPFRPQEPPREVDGGTKRLKGSLLERAAAAEQGWEQPGAGEERVKKRKGGFCPPREMVAMEALRDPLPMEEETRNHSPFLPMRSAEHHSGSEHRSGSILRRAVQASRERLHHPQQSPAPSDGGPTSPPKIQLASLPPPQLQLRGPQSSHRQAPLVELLEKRVRDNSEYVRRQSVPSSLSPKAKAATTKRNGEPKKKRGTTGYLVFCKEMREEVRAEMEAELGDGEKLQAKLVNSELAKRWKELDDAEKTTWNDKAKPLAKGKGKGMGKGKGKGKDKPPGSSLDRHTPRRGRGRLPKGKGKGKAAAPGTVLALAASGAEDSSGGLEMDEAAAAAAAAESPQSRQIAVVPKPCETYEDLMNLLEEKLSPESRLLLEGPFGDFVREDFEFRVSLRNVQEDTVWPSEEKVCRPSREAYAECKAIERLLVRGGAANEMDGKSIDRLAEVLLDMNRALTGARDARESREKTLNKSANILRDVFAQLGGGGGKGEKLEKEEEEEGEEEEGEGSLSKETKVALLSGEIPEAEARGLVGMHIDGLPSINDEPDVLVAWARGMGYKGDAEDLLKMITNRPHDLKPFIKSLGLS